MQSSLEGSPSRVYEQPMAISRPSAENLQARYESGLLRRCFRRWAREARESGSAEPITRGIVAFSGFKWISATLGQEIVKQRYYTFPVMSSTIPTGAIHAATVTATALGLAVQPSINSLAEVKLNEHRKQRLRQYAVENMQVSIERLPYHWHAVALLDAFCLRRIFYLWKQWTRQRCQFDHLNRQIAGRAALRFWLRWTRYSQRLRLMIQYQARHSLYELPLKDTWYKWRLLWKSTRYFRRFTLYRMIRHGFGQWRAATQHIHQIQHSITCAKLFYERKHCVAAFLKWLSHLCPLHNTIRAMSSPVVQRYICEYTRYILHHSTYYVEQNLQHKRNRSLIFWKLSSPSLQRSHGVGLNGEELGSLLHSEPLVRMISVLKNRLMSRLSQYGLEVIGSSFCRMRRLILAIRRWSRHTVQRKMDSSFVEVKKLNYSSSLNTSPNRDMRLSNSYRQGNPDDEWLSRLPQASAREFGGSPDSWAESEQLNVGSEWETPQVWQSPNRLQFTTLPSNQSPIESLPVSHDHYHTWKPERSPLRISYPHRYSSPLRRSHHDTVHVTSPPVRCNAPLWRNSAYRNLGRYYLTRWVRFYRFRSTLAQKGYQLLTRNNFRILSERFGMWIIAAGKSQHLSRIEHRIFCARVRRETYIAWFAWRRQYERAILIRTHQRELLLQKAEEIRQFKELYQTRVALKTQQNVLQTWALYVRQRQRGKFILSIIRRRWTIQLLCSAFLQWRITTSMDIIATVVQKLWRGYCVRFLTYRKQYQELVWFRQRAVRNLFLYVRYRARRHIFRILKRYQESQQIWFSHMQKQIRSRAIIRRWWIQYQLLRRRQRKMVGLILPFERKHLLRYGWRRLVVLYKRACWFRNTKKRHILEKKRFAFQNICLLLERERNLRCLGYRYNKIRSKHAICRWYYTARSFSNQKDLLYRGHQVLQRHILRRWKKFASLECRAQRRAYITGREHRHSSLFKRWRAETKRRQQLTLFESQKLRQRCRRALVTWCRNSRTIFSLYRRADWHRWYIQLARGWKCLLNYPRNSILYSHADNYRRQALLERGLRSLRNYSKTWNCVSHFQFLSSGAHLALNYRSVRTNIVHDRTLHPKYRFAVIRLRIVFQQLAAWKVHRQARRFLLHEYRVRLEWMKKRHFLRQLTLQWRAAKLKSRNTAVIPVYEAKKQSRLRILLARESRIKKIQSRIRRQVKLNEELVPYSWYFNHWLTFTQEHDRLRRILRGIHLRWIVGQQRQKWLRWMRYATRCRQMRARNGQISHQFIQSVRRNVFHRLRWNAAHSRHVNSLLLSHHRSYYLLFLRQSVRRWIRFVLRKPRMVQFRPISLRFIAKLTRRARFFFAQLRQIVYHNRYYRPVQLVQVKYQERLRLQFRKFHTLCQRRKCRQLIMAVVSSGNVEKKITKYFRYWRRWQLMKKDLFRIRRRFFMIRCWRHWCDETRQKLKDDSLERRVNKMMKKRILSNVLCIWHLTYQLHTRDRKLSEIVELRNAQWVKLRVFQAWIQSIDQVMLRKHFDCIKHRTDLFLKRRVLRQWQQLTLLSELVGHKNLRSAYRNWRVHVLASQLQRISILRGYQFYLRKILGTGYGYPVSSTAIECNTHTENMKENWIHIRAASSHSFNNTSFQSRFLHPPLVRGNLKFARGHGCLALWIVFLRRRRWLAMTELFALKTFLQKRAIRLLRRWVRRIYLIRYKLGCGPPPEELVHSDDSVYGEAAIRRHKRRQFSRRREKKPIWSHHISDSDDAGGYSDQFEGCDGFNDFCWNGSSFIRSQNFRSTRPSRNASRSRSFKGRLDYGMLSNSGFNFHPLSSDAWSGLRRAFHKLHRYSQAKQSKRKTRLLSMTFLPWRTFSKQQQLLRQAFCDRLQQVHRRELLQKGWNLLRFLPNLKMRHHEVLLLHGKYIIRHNFRYWLSQTTLYHRERYAMQTLINGIYKLSIRDRFLTWRVRTRYMKSIGRVSLMKTLWKQWRNIYHAVVYHSRFVLFRCFLAWRREVSAIEGRRAILKSRRMLLWRILARRMSCEFRQLVVAFIKWRSGHGAIRLYRYEKYFDALRQAAVPLLENGKETLGTIAGDDFTALDDTRLLDAVAAAATGQKFSFDGHSTNEGTGEMQASILRELARSQAARILLFNAYGGPDVRPSESVWAPQDFANHEARGSTTRIPRSVQVQSSFLTRCEDEVTRDLVNRQSRTRQNVSLTKRLEEQGRSIRGQLIHSSTMPLREKMALHTSAMRSRTGHFVGLRPSISSRQQLNTLESISLHETLDADRSDFNLRDLL